MGKKKEVSWGSPKYLKMQGAKQDSSRMRKGSLKKNRICKVTKGDHEGTWVPYRTSLDDRSRGFSLMVLKCKCGKHVNTGWRCNRCMEMTERYSWNEDMCYKCRDNINAENMAKAKPVVVNVVLDKSGSMTSVRDATISGINEYLQGLRNDKKNRYSVSVTLFDDKYKTVIEDKDVSKVKDFNRETYSPDGWTALYDAVCHSVNELKKKYTKDDKVLTVIMTDGGENSSKEYTQENLKELVNELEKNGKWKFVFLGANQDAWEVAGKWGLDKSSVSSFNATSKGLGQTFSTNTAATLNYAASSDTSSGRFAFYSKEDKEKMEGTK